MLTFGLCEKALEYWVILYQLLRAGLFIGAIDFDIRQVCLQFSMMYWTLIGHILQKKMAITPPHKTAHIFLVGIFWS